MKMRGWDLTRSRGDAEEEAEKKGNEGRVGIRVHRVAEPAENAEEACPSCARMDKAERYPAERAIGFIGFGEAGFHIAKGLREAGAGEVVAYDLHTHTPGKGELIRRRAESAGVSLVESNAAVAARCGVLLSTVTADQACIAAERMAPHLRADHLYADLNSVSPDAKQRVARTVALVKPPASAECDFPQRRRGAEISAEKQEEGRRSMLTGSTRRRAESADGQAGGLSYAGRVSAASSAG